VTHSYTWLIHIRDMTLSCVLSWLSASVSWFILVPWLLASVSRFIDIFHSCWRVCHYSRVWPDSLYVWYDPGRERLFHHAWPDSIIRVTRPICVCASFRPYVWHDPFKCVTCCIHAYDLPHPHVWHASFVRLTHLAHTCGSHVCDMTHSYLPHALFFRVAWLIPVWDTLAYQNLRACANESVSFFCIGIFHLFVHHVSFIYIHWPTTNEREWSMSSTIHTRHEWRCDSLICVSSVTHWCVCHLTTWLVHVCDSFTCVTRLFHICDVTRA